MKSTVRWAIVGPGIIARKFAKDLRVVEDAELHAIAGRDLGRAQAFATEWGAATAYDDLHALASDPAVDIVYIAVPHPAHFPAAKLLLEAGKSVLCEKPLTVNARQARELIQISQTRQVLLMEALWTRYLPVYAKVREWISEGRIGQPLIVSSALCIQPPIDPANRFFSPGLAGGGLLDVGIYSVAMSQFVMGRSPVAITAQARMTDTGVDEFLSASLQYDSGGIAQFACGIRPLFENSLVIGGEKGLIRVPSRFIHGKEATIEIEGVSETFRLDHRSGGFEFQIEEAIRCHRSGEIESPLMPHADSLANVEVMDAIRQQIGLRYPDETA